MFGSFLIVLMVFLWNSRFTQSQEFCDEYSTLVTSVRQLFLIKDNIYLGGNQVYWTLNANTFEMQPTKSIADIFSGLTLSMVRTAVHFDNISCKGKGNEFCKQTSKAKDLVLAVGREGSALSGRYQAFRTGSNGTLTAVKDKSEMPWNLEIESEFNGTFFYNIRIFGFTFQERTNTLFISGSDPISPKNEILFYYKSLDDDGKFEGPSFHRKANVPRIYIGLVDWKSKLFGLDDKHNFYELVIEGQDVKEKYKYTFSDFLNCNNNSPLNFTEPEEEGSVSSVSSAVGSVGSVTHSPDQAVGSSPESGVGSKKDSTLLWIIVALIIVIILIVAIVAAVIFLRPRNKENDGKVVPNSEPMESVKTIKSQNTNNSSPMPQSSVAKSSAVKSTPMKSSNASNTSNVNEMQTIRSGVKN